MNVSHVNKKQVFAGFLSADGTGTRDMTHSALIEMSVCLTALVFLR